MLLQRRTNQKGFTLTEMLVVILILGILSLTIADFITNWLQAASLAQARTNLLTNAETALDTVTNDIRLSGSAEQNNRWSDTNGPGGNTYGWQSNSTTLVLAEIAVDSSHNVIYSDPAKYISEKDDQIFYLSGSTLYRRTLASDNANDSAKNTCPPNLATQSCKADKVVATGVTNWSVSYYDADQQIVAPTSARSVQIALTLTQTINKKSISASYSTRMVFRNG